jgi:hypothetical protein
MGTDTHFITAWGEWKTGRYRVGHRVVKAQVSADGHIGCLRIRRPYRKFSLLR